MAADVAASTCAMDASTYGRAATRSADGHQRQASRRHGDQMTSSRHRRSYGDDRTTHPAGRRHDDCDPNGVATSTADRDLTVRRTACRVGQYARSRHRASVTICRGHLVRWQAGSFRLRPLSRCDGLGRRSPAIGLDGVARPSTSASGGGPSRSSRASTSRSSTATCSACWGRTAPARRRPSRSPWGSCGPRSGSVELGVAGPLTRRLPAREPVLLRLPLRPRVPELLRAALRTGRATSGASASSSCSRDVGLSDAADTHLRKYSKGMLQRIGIAQALINDPELVLLDEPMTGLDPVGRVEVKRIIERLHERGKTVMFNSHILSDVHELCSHIAIMRDGRVVWQGTCRRGAGRGPDARGLLHEGGHGVKQLVAIAVNTFKETIRDRVLAVIVVFALLMIAGGLWLGSISLGEQGRMMKDFGLVAVTRLRPHRRRVRRREPGAQGGREAHRLRAVLQAGEPRRVHRRQVRRPVRHAWPWCSPAWALFLFAARLGRRRASASGMVLLAVVMIYVQLLAVMAVTIFFSTLGSAILASRARHLRVRRRAAQPQRAGADAPRARTRSPRRSPGSST